MSNVGYATLTILPSARGFSSALGREINPALTAAGATSGEHSGKAFGGGFLPAMKSMIGPAVGMAAGLALGTGIKSGLETAAFLEQAKISFQTLLGPGGDAEGFLSSLSAFAAKTPFELPGLTSNARALLGVGIAAKDVIPTMTALGDAAGALGLSQDGLNSVVRAYTQINSKGKVSAEEMLQMAEAGIPAWPLLARAMGMTVPEVQKLGEEGKLLAADVLPKLNAQMEKEYGGSMAKQAQTLSGVWSTVKDTLNMAMAQALQPLVPLLTTVLPPAAQALAGAIGWISDAASGLLTLIVGGDFTGALTRAFGWQEDSGAVDFLLTLREAVVGFFGELKSGQGAGEVFKTITDSLTPLWTIISTQVLPALQNLGNAIVTGVQPVLQVIGDIIRTSIVPAFQEMATKAGPLFTQLGQTINVVATQIGPILQGIADVIRNVWGFIGPFVMDTLVGMFNNVVGIFSGVFTVIQGVVNLVSALFRGDWAAAWDALGQIVSGAVQAVWNFVQLWIVGKLTALVGGAMGALRGLFGGAWDFIVGIFRGAGSSISSFVGWLMAGLQGVFAGGMAAVRGAVAGGIDGVVGFFSGLAGRVLGAVGNAGGWLLGVGRDLIAGLANGIRNAAGMIRDAVANAIGNVVDFAKSLLGIHSPSRVFMEIGNFTAKGMAIGLLKGAKYVQKAASVLIPEAPSYTAPTVANGGLQGALAAVAGSGSAQPTIVQENHFNTPMSEEAYAELAARKLLRAGVGR